MTQTLKRILKKAEYENKYPYLALLEYRNTPRADLLYFSAEILTSKRLRSKIPCAVKLLKPCNVDDSINAEQSRQKFYYNKRSKTFKPLEKGRKCIVNKAIAEMKLLLWLLDVEIRLIKTGIDTWVYRKPTNTNLILNFNALCLTKWKSGCCSRLQTFKMRKNKGKQFYLNIISIVCHPNDTMLAILNCFYFQISSATTTNKLKQSTSLQSSTIQITYKPNSSFSITHCANTKNDQL